MEVIALQSGSSGNCIYVEAGGKQLLFDAGISGIQAETRLADHGRDIRDIDALIISHDHRDHAVGMGIYQRKYGLPIYVTRATLAVAREKIRLGKLEVALLEVRCWRFAARLRRFAAGGSPLP